MVLALASGCGRPVLGGPDHPGDTFIAFASDFDGYVRWESFSLQGAPVQGEVHASGDRTVYLSRPPPQGAREFPVGTMIVKALPGVGRVFARAKRGGGYDAYGAVGWEWLELQHVSAEDVTVVWRGVGPPTGEGYGGDPNGCNSCHGQFAFNDYVATAQLRL